MKRFTVIVVQVLVVALLMSVAVIGHAESAASVSPDKALEMLMEGNLQYSQGNLANLVVNSKPAARDALTAGQHPYAVVIDCSDSRVSPEIIFNKGLGEVFVIRVAGNVVAPHQLGSIEYAVEHLGSPLIMVLGHSRCGAVGATVGALDPRFCRVANMKGNIGSLVESIAPAVEKSCDHHAEDLLGASIDENVNMVAEKIELESSIIKEALEAGHVKIVKARYDLEDGIVKLLSE